MQHRTTTPCPASTPSRLTQALAREGWHEGPSWDLPVLALLVDLETVEEMICPDCGTIGLNLLVMHRDGHYRGVSSCECGFEEEV
jgi:hypothetical protein